MQSLVSPLTRYQSISRRVVGLFWGALACLFLFDATVGELEDSEQSSRPNLYSVAGFKILPSTLHLVVRTACLLSPMVYLIHVIRSAKIVDECSTDYIYLAALSHINIIRGNIWTLYKLTFRTQILVWRKASPIFPLVCFQIIISIYIFVWIIQVHQQGPFYQEKIDIILALPTLFCASANTFPENKVPIMTKTIISWTSF